MNPARSGASFLIGGVVGNSPNTSTVASRIGRSAASVGDNGEVFREVTTSASILARTSAVVPVLMSDHVRRFIIVVVQVY